MISIEEAYTKMKEHLDDSPIFIDETEESFIFNRHGNGFETINKSSGDVGYIWMHEYFDLLEHKAIHPVYMDVIFDDILNKYNDNPDESNVAYLFALCWNCSQGDYSDDYSIDDFEAYMAIKDKFKELKDYFRTKIDELIDWNAIVYPPIVQNKLDDEYYKLKPFMVKHGYTTSMGTDRCWHRV